ncbi:hypothetical protein CQW23_01977 [Capsicum baccatum]|uniref:Uncharacterized protein n=1 Tax=Capsicum baccatum TaxID=33114 RepID=A0A2G2XQ51_CAPBA|nr:hypothetical protein CQW23_01977 [Capsicum baccatum]
MVFTIRKVENTNYRDTALPTILVTMTLGVLRLGTSLNRGQELFLDAVREPQRCLILIEDVWEATAWDYLKPCFCDANNGSRIILTTQLGDVASHAKLDSDPHFLRLFTPEASWMFLMFNTKSCPLILEDDEEKQVSKLTWLWTAEDSVKTRKEMLSEDIAEYYLKNLIGRNLVMVSKKSSDDKIKACRIHDLWLDFCKKKAKVENFLQCIKGDNDMYPSSISYQKHSILRRLCIHFQGDNLAEWSSICPDVQSFHLMTGREIGLSSISHASQTFKQSQVSVVARFRIHYRVFTMIPNLQKLRCEVLTCEVFFPAFNNLLSLKCLSSLGVVGDLHSNVWQVTYEQFPNLKFLKLRDPSFSEWNVSDDAFPCLENLVLRRWRHLEEILSGFAYMLTLNSIEVMACKKLLVELAKNIRKTQVEMPNTALYPEIERSYLDPQMPARFG